MLQDPRFQKIVTVLFWGGFFILFLFTGFLIAGVVLGVDNRDTPEAVAPKDPKDSFSSIPEDSVPKTFGEKARAPSLAILPNRAPDGALAPAPIDSAVESKILQASENFILSWEDFPSPLMVSREYGESFKDLVARDSRESITSRADVVTWSDLCPQKPCSLGSFPSSRASLFVADYNGQEAYVVGYGVISVLPDDPSFDQRGGAEFEQSYGLLLRKVGTRWLVYRAAAETLDRIS